MVSGHYERVIVEAARALGAAAFLPKSLGIDALASSLRVIMRGGAVFPDEAAEQGPIQTARERIATLSGSQLKVMLALADGRLNKQIASDLGISEATVKAHMTAIFRKLGVKNRAQALLAMQPLLGDAGKT
jgi:DNA-binding NarL/FixJ family response regulator